MNQPAKKPSQDHVESFALQLSVFRLQRFVTPVVPANANPKILHAPVYDELLENSATRATGMLRAVLAQLEARNATDVSSARVDIIS